MFAKNYMELKDTKDRRDHLGVILKAMDAAED